MPVRMERMTEHDADLEERYRRFREMCARVAAENSQWARALYWRDKSFEERAQAGLELMRLTDSLGKSWGKKPGKEIGGRIVPRRKTE